MTLAKNAIMYVTCNTFAYFPFTECIIFADLLCGVSRRKVLFQRLDFSPHSPVMQTFVRTAFYELKEYNIVHQNAASFTDINE